MQQGTSALSALELTGCGATYQMDNSSSGADGSPKPTFLRKMKGKTNNTSAPSSKVKRLHRQLAGIMAHLEKNPRDSLSQARVSTINQLLTGR